MKPYFRIVLLIIFAVVMLALGTSAEYPDRTVTASLSEPFCTVSYNGEQYSLSVGGEVLAEKSALSDLLEEAAGLDMPVYFSSVKSDEALIISSGRLTLSGSISLKEPLTVKSGADVTLCDINLSFTERGYLNIRGGSVTLSSGVITSVGNAVTLGYSSSSSFTMRGGEILGASGTPCISVERGSAAFASGYVKNSQGVALVNYSSTELGASVIIDGTGYDVYAYEPLTLSFEDKPFSSSLSVRYMSDFADGTLTQVFFSAGEQMKDKIELYDINGREYDLTFFHSYDGYTEDDFFAVYLPYTLTYMSMGEVKLVESYLSDEPTAEGGSFAPSGFTHLGWYSDPGLEGRFYFGGTLSESTVIYARYELEHLSYSLNDLRFEYDAREHFLTFSELYHTCEGVYNFEWTDMDGRVVANTESLPLRYVSDSGKYKCKITFTSGEYVTVAETPFIDVVITKKRINPPTIPPKSYNGRIQYPDISSTSFFTVEDSGYENVGVYMIRLSLVDPDNYAWCDTGDRETFVCFEITKAENYWIEPLEVNNVYLGAELEYVCIPGFGSVKLLFSSYRDGEYGSDPPDSVGVYYIKAVVEAGDNWSGIESEPIAFSVMEDRVLSLGIEQMPYKTRYIAFEYFDTEGLVLVARYSSGREEEVSADSVSVHYQSADSLRTAHSGVFCEYRGLKIIVPIEVVRADYNFDLELSDGSFVFDGIYHSLTPSGVFPTGKDGVAVDCKVIGGGINAGSYTVTLRFTVRSTEYNQIPDMTAVLTVLPRETEVRWENTSFVYDGTSKQPYAYYTDIYGAKIPLQVVGSAVTVGNGYTASAVCSDGNYALLGDSTAFVIRKADYDMTGVFWSGASFVYDGERHAVYLSGLPDGVRVVGYVNNSAVEAGDYSAKAIITYDTENYNPPCVDDYVWSIARADYDLSGITFTGGEYIFSGTPYYPIVTGEIPAGADGTRPEYSFSEGIVNASPDLQFVYVSFTVSSKNYNTPGSVTVPIKVLQKGITVRWTVENYVYDGNMHIPAADAEECGIRVEGAGINAGSYTAVVVCSDPNYFVINSEQNYTVSRAENRFVSSVSVPDIFLGQSLAPCGDAYFGKTVFKYYTDAECQTEIDEPWEVGVYYAVATVGISENYFELRSEPVRFEIIAVVPVAIRVSLADRVYTAFERLTASDLVCIAVNNDGSEEEIAFSRLCILYQTGSCLLAKDSCLGVEYGSLSAVCPISVSRAALDLSGALWHGTSYVYDGEAKSPTLVGLPDGVTVLEYIGAGVTGAGEYTVQARLGYDTDNYFLPDMPETVMVIQKCPITPSLIGDAVYCGAPITPVTDSTLCSPIIDEAPTDAGEYKIYFRLNDTDNYYLTEEYVLFVIAPAPITVNIDNYTLYLGESISDYGYTVTEGVIFDGDELKLTFTEQDGKITAASENANYLITQTGGNIEYINTLSPDRGRSILYSVIGGIILILLFLVLVFRRDALVVLVSGFVKRIKQGGGEASAVTIDGTNDVTTETEGLLSVDAERAETMISDSVAKALIRKSGGASHSFGKRKCIINVDTLSEHFSAGDTVDICALKAKGLIPEDAGYIKVLGRGILDKPLKIYANRFSLTAVKMIALTGGEANKVIVKRGGEKKEKKG